MSKNALSIPAVVLSLGNDESQDVIHSLMNFVSDWSTNLSSLFHSHNAERFHLNVDIAMWLLHANVNTVECRHNYWS